MLLPLPLPLSLPPHLLAPPPHYAFNAHKSWVFGSYLGAGGAGGVVVLVVRLSPSQVPATFHLLFGLHFGVSFSGRMPLI